jgi:uncharacterized protein YaiI (UPF0178 family)
MNIWVDADACPKAVKKILFRTADRLKIQVMFVSCQYIQTPRSAFIKPVQVPGGPDSADDYIAGQLKKDDLAITADIPLASRIVDKGGFALNPRGQFYNKENIKQILTMRNFMDELRSTGVETGGPDSFSQRDLHNFANQLDRLLNQQL